MEKISTNALAVTFGTLTRSKTSGIKREAKNFLTFGTGAAADFVPICKGNFFHFFAFCSCNFLPICYTLRMMIKNGKQQNVVPTTAEQNMAAAKVCKTYNEAVKLFRALQHANNRGTGEHQFDLLEKHFEKVNG